MWFLRLYWFFSECFKAAGITGLIAGAKYKLGLFTIVESYVKSSAFAVGDIYDGSV